MGSEKPGLVSRVLRSALVELQGVVHSGSNPLWRGYVNCLVFETPLFRGMPTGLKAF